MLDQIETKDEVSEFSAEEMFFSRTDKRGVIQAGNEVFYRVAKYDHADLIGAPHKIVRHPDMPKALFWIMWDMLKRNEPIGAYVKNRASDGSYYWVFAMTTPTEDGYLSVRQKPCSDKLAMVEQLYLDIRNRELTEEISAEKSAQILIESLKEMGWDSYVEFMTDALVEECNARAEKASRSTISSMQEVSELKQNAASTLGIAQDVLDDFSTIAGFPVNMHIQASKLKANGRIFGSIADNYQRLSKRVEASMRDFIEARKSAAQTVDRGLFQLMVALQQAEMVKVFQDERHVFELTGEDRSDAKTEFDLEISVLDTQRAVNHENSIRRLNEISSEYKKFTHLIDEMSGILSALSVTQFVGLVETARLEKDGQTLKAMLQDVTGVQNQAQENLKKLETLNREVATKVGQLSGSLRNSS